MVAARKYGSSSSCNNNNNKWRIDRQSIGWMGLDLLRSSLAVGRSWRGEERRMQWMDEP
uniref:Uncharacterized protein n=1 Tax=Arundo donax TaxID=35708 RepID=A0A0A9BGN3_ARUDO